MEKYCDTNLNHYIKIKLTEEGRIIYKKYYNSHNCEAPKLDIDDEGYVRFQIHDFMHIFGERLFMGATLPCETNCKIQVKDEWHYVKDELPRKSDSTLCELMPVFVAVKVGYKVSTYGTYWNLKIGKFECLDEVYAWCYTPEPPELPKESD